LKKHLIYTKGLELPELQEVVLSSREMGRIYHAYGVERLVRNDLWKDQTQAEFYRSVEWLYGWKVENCFEK
jgi:salicylate hydroxylase